MTARNWPLPASAIAKFLMIKGQLLEEDKDSVRNIIQALYAVLYEDGYMQNAIRVLHYSFLDYLDVKLMQGATTGWSKPEDVHRLMFSGCFATMHHELKFSACCLQDATLLNKNISNLKQLIIQHVSQELQYSAQFWFVHLSMLDQAGDSESRILDLLCSTKVFFGSKS